MKSVCDNRRCGWRGDHEELLSAPDPFDSCEMIYACPDCREIGTTRQACDVPGCWEPATCGTPTADGGYRWTCCKHQPEFGGE